MNTDYIDELIYNDMYKEEIEFAKKQQKIVDNEQCPDCKEYSLISVPDEIFLCAKCNNLFYYDEEAKKIECYYNNKKETSHN